jgi:branched-subunit amino acid aminotransferase/4-amino-4-deoxychorismate lyase
MNSTTGKYISLNGQYLLAEQPHLSHTNRSFCYGDGLFETIHTNAVNLHFFADHYERLISGMKVLKMEIPRSFSPEYLETEISGLIKRNRMFTGNRVRLSVFRNPGGAYTPHDQTISWLIEVSSLPEADYRLNEKGLMIDIYPEMKKPVNLISGFKSSNALIYTLAGIYKMEKGLDDCLVINEKNRIAEATSSNVFLVKNNSLHTPPASEGPVMGILRQQLLMLAKQMRISVFEQEIQPGYLLDADECFLTNTVSGIRWVMGFRHKRFYNKLGQELLHGLNQLIKQD